MHIKNVSNGFEILWWWLCHSTSGTFFSLPGRSNDYVHQHIDWFLCASLLLHLSPIVLLCAHFAHLIACSSFACSRWNFLRFFLWLVKLTVHIRIGDYFEQSLKNVKHNWESRKFQEEKKTKSKHSENNYNRIHWMSSNEKALFLYRVKINNSSLYKHQNEKLTRRSHHQHHMRIFFHMWVYFYITIDVCWSIVAPTRAL